MGHGDGGVRLCSTTAHRVTSREQIYHYDSIKVLHLDKTLKFRF